MWVSKKLDLSWGDFWFALTACFSGGRSVTAQTEVEQIWSADGDAIACQSVRSGFDLLLQALALPRRSEVIITALTVADMPRICRDHGLVPVPVDIDVATLAPSPEEVAGLIGKNTRALVLTHLYGSRIDVTPFLDLGREHDILVIEDCAQAYAGRHYTGHPESDVTMFSFGSIKTATALGGGLLRVKDPHVLRKMRAIQNGYPTVRLGEYGWRVVKYAMLHALSKPAIYGILVDQLRTFGVRHDEVVHRLTRAFTSGSGFREWLRRRPPVPMLRLLKRRLLEDDERLESRMADGDRLAGLLSQYVTLPGSEAEDHGYWVFPILTTAPEKIVESLLAEGFDGNVGRSLEVVPIPDSGKGSNSSAALIQSQVVFLPFYPEIPPAEYQVMADIVKFETRRLGAGPRPERKLPG